MKNHGNFIVIFFVVICMLFAVNCSSGGSGEAVVSIDTGLGLLKGATKAAAPSNITAITLGVTGGDIEPVDETFTLSGTATGEITGTSGTYDPETGVIKLTTDPGALTFSVTAAVNPADPGVVLSYSGSASAEIAEGENSVQVEMGIGETKIVIPDYNYTWGDAFSPPTGALMQINNMSDSSPIIMGPVEYGLGESNTLFRPYDVAIDSAGRIYIANGYNGTGGAIIYRIDNMSDNTLETVFQSDGSIIALEINQQTNTLFFIHSVSGLNAVQLDSADAPTPLDLSGLSEPGLSGLSIDSSGQLYIANGAGTPPVVRYNPATQSITAQYDDATVLSAEDVLFKGSYVYVGDFDSSFYYGDGINDSRIIVLNPDLTFVRVIAYNPDNASDTIYGPRRFIATLNRRIYFIDEESEQDFFGEGRILVFDDLYGTNWLTKSDGAAFEFFDIYY